MNPDANLQIDLMTVTASHQSTIDAVGAEISVKVTGSQFFVGSAALTKAREIASLAALLRDVGLTDDDIKLQDVKLEQGSGFGKSSSATYTLKVICKPMSRVGDVVAVLSQAKYVELVQTEWTYDDSDAACDAWLELATVTARKRAERLATATDVRLEGVHRLECQITAYESHVGRAQIRSLEDAGRQALSRSRQSSPPTWSDLGGPSVSHQKTVSAHVLVIYRLSGFLH
jgi:uncharacterized protein YggE